MDWERIRRGKEQHRAAAARRPFEEKLRTLERLHERDRPLRASRERWRAREVCAPGTTVQGICPQASSGVIHVALSGANAALVALAAPTSFRGHATLQANAHAGDRH